jgi:hypothetical protein
MNHTAFISTAVAVASPTPDTIHATVTSHRAAGRNQIITGLCCRIVASPACAALAAIALGAGGAG